MIKTVLCLLIAVALLSVVPAKAQDFPMLHYTVEDGLPSNTVYSVYRDSKGFLWIATDKGIARYNGIKFETFTTFNGLPDNEIFFFTEDYYGRLWLGTFNGELCYYKDDTFHTAANTPFLKLPGKYPHIEMISVEKDSSVNVIFLDKSRFVNVSLVKCQVIDISKIESERADHFVKILSREKLDENKYKIFTINGIFVMDTIANVVARNHINYYTYSLSEFAFWRVTYCQDQIVLNNNNYLFTRQLKIIKPFDYNRYKNSFIYQIYFNDKGCFITTDHGVILNDSLQFLSDNKISYLTQDRDGNYWACSLENGIFIINKDFTGANLFRNVYSGKVAYVFQDQDRLFFATTKNEVDLVENGWVKQLINYAAYVPSEKSSSIASGFFIDSNYRFYNYYNKVSIVIENLLKKPLSIRQYKSDLDPTFAIKNVLKTGDEIFVNARSGIFNLVPGQFNTNELHYKRITDSLQTDRIFCMAKAPGNAVWYATIDKMYKIENGERISLPQFKKVIFKLFYFFDKYLIGYTHDNQLVICSNYNDGLIVDSIASQNCIWENFYKLDATHLLISTNNFYRLLTIYPDSAARHYDIWAIENNFIPLQAEAISSDGRNCVFFKDGSVTSVEVKSLFVKPTPPQLFFTMLKAGKKTYRISDKMEIPYAQSKNLGVFFSTLSFSSKNVFYQFSAASKGDSDLWRDVTGDALNLYNLGYGSHTIKLRAKSISSDYSKPIVFSLYVLRPFWATWWFTTLCTAVFLLVLGVAIRARLQYLLQKNKKAHESEVKFMKSEYKALNALMNPHFIFNTLNNVQSLVNDNNKLAANEYLRVFADLIRQNMHNISKELIPLQKEMDLVTNYLALEKLRFEDKLTYTINIDENTDLTDIMVPPLLIQPLVENSIKHGILPQKNSRGAININVYERQGTLYIEVKDNGAGINNAQTKTDIMHESFGLENIKTRIQQLSVIQDKDISLTIHEMKDSTGNIEGTIVTITMPIS